MNYNTQETNDHLAADDSLANAEPDVSVVPEPKKAARVPSTRSTAIEFAVQQERALNLRKAGLNYAQIAQTMQITRRYAGKLVASALARTYDRVADLTTELRMTELARYEQITTKLWPGVMRSHVPTILAYIAVSRAKRELMGLDMPMKIDATSGGKPIGDSIDRFREELLSRINRRAEQAEQGETPLLAEG